MRFNDISVSVLARGERNEPYTSFSVKEDEPSCFAFFAGDNMTRFEGYEQANAKIQPDSILVVIPQMILNMKLRINSRKKSI